MCWAPRPTAVPRFHSFLLLHHSSGNWSSSDSYFYSVVAPHETHDRAFSRHFSHAFFAIRVSFGDTSSHHKAALIHERMFGLIASAECGRSATILITSSVVVNRAPNDRTYSAGYRCESASSGHVRRENCVFISIGHSYSSVRRRNAVLLRTASNVHYRLA